MVTVDPSISTRGLEIHTYALFIRCLWICPQTGTGKPDARAVVYHAKRPCAIELLHDVQALALGAVVIVMFDSGSSAPLAACWNLITGDYLTEAFPQSRGK